jgi:hypothetical protein
MDKMVLAIVAIVVTIGLAGVAVVDGDNIIIKQKQAFARGCESSLPHSAGGEVGLNASQGRCFGH